MKTIEQKAKAYDEALKVLHKYDGANIMFSQSLKEEMFPELAESEDESIRKKLISYFSSVKGFSSLEYNYGITGEDAVAWLEKQGTERKQLYVRFGDIPSNEKSKIYRGEEKIGEENGVSVYPAFELNGNIVLGLTLPITRTTLYTQQHLLEYDNRPCYLVSGDYVGSGTDGEPLIRNISIIKRLDNYRIKEIEKQDEQKSMKVYRVENEAEQKGLWRKFDGTWQPLFDMLTDGKCKDMPMEDRPIYREGGKRWFASAPSKEALQKWFSKRDLEELVSKGFTISEFEVVGHKKVSDFEYIFTRDNIINRNYLEVSDIYSEQRDFAPKVKPKFKVGDWIVSKTSNLVYRVDSILFPQSKCYYLSHNGGIVLVSFADEQNYRLWSIQDAKDGDVLKEDSCTFIIERMKHDETAIIHCCLFDDGDFDLGSTLSFDVDSTYPATKEQRDLLFQKMREAGYEWDAEKKELKKIDKENLTEFEIAVKNVMEEAIEAGDTHNLKSDAENLLRIAKPTWGEDDEKLAQAKKDAYNDALDKIEYHSGEPTFDDGWDAAIWYLKKKG